MGYIGTKVTTGYIFGLYKGNNGKENGMTENGEATCGPSALGLAAEVSGQACDVPIVICFGAAFFMDTANSSPKAASS